VKLGATIGPKTPAGIELFLLIENLVERKQFGRPTHLHSMQASKPHPQNSNPCTYFRLADGVSFGKKRKR